MSAAEPITMESFLDKMVRPEYEATQDKRIAATNAVNLLPWQSKVALLGTDKYRPLERFQKLVEKVIPLI